MSSTSPAPGSLSPAGRASTKPASTNAPGEKKAKKPHVFQSKGKNLFRDGAFGPAKPGEHVSSQATAGGRRRRRKSKRKSRKKSRKKKRKTKRRRKSRKKKSKRRRRR